MPAPSSSGADAVLTKKRRQSASRDASPERSKAEGSAAAARDEAAPSGADRPSSPAPLSTESGAKLDQWASGLRLDRTAVARPSDAQLLRWGTDNGVMKRLDGMPPSDQLADLQRLYQRVFDAHRKRVESAPPASPARSPARSSAQKSAGAAAPTKQDAAPRKKTADALRGGPNLFLSAMNTIQDAHRSAADLIALPERDDWRASELWSPSATAHSGSRGREAARLQPAWEQYARDAQVGLLTKLLDQHHLYEDFHKTVMLSGADKGRKARVGKWLSDHQTLLDGLFKFDTAEQQAHIDQLLQTLD